MTTFLSDIASYLYNKYADGISGITMVFPNKRAGLFFRYYLSETAKKPLWSPQIHTISSFIQSLSPLQLADKYSLLFNLYDVYSAVNIKAGNQFNESIDKFFFWGNMLLADFDDIDKSLAPAGDLFKNIAALKNIDEYYNHLEPEQVETLRIFWKNILVSRPSKEKDAFIKIWDVLALIYRNFTEKILAENQAYEGLIYRQVAEATSGEIELPEKIVFAGFNTLSQSEKVILSYCTRHTETLFFWDFEEVFLNKEQLDTTAILKSNLLEFPPPVDFKPDSAMKNLTGKKVEIIGIPQEVGQVKSAAEMLGKMFEAGTPMEINQAAIVLPSEYLLYPLLNSLPSTIKGINITMGYPLKNTNLATFLESVLSLLKNKQLNKDNRANYYHHDVSEILKHPCIYHLNSRKNQELLEDIIHNNRIYINETRLSEISETTDLIFKSENHRGFLLDYLTVLLKELYRQENKAGHEFEVEFIYRFYTDLNRLKEIVAEKKIEISVETQFSLIREIIRSTRLPFSGEPLAEIQVMGVMETRCLDFKNLFILSMNEGKWPPSHSLGSFIPFNIRKGFRLPTYREEEAIYSYNFYRLLQRAENIVCFFNTETGYNGEGEKSRFLNQLKYDSGFKIHESVMKLPVKPAVTSGILLKKEDASLKILQKYIAGSEGNSRLSPTALNSYLDCRLKFYYTYVAGLNEPETVSDEIDAAIFGNLLHACLEYIYVQWMENPAHHNLVKTADFEPLKGLVEQSIIHAFNTLYNPGSKDFVFEGNNLLIRNILQKYINGILKIDSNYAPFTIISLENSKSYTTDILLNKSNICVKLKGTIDRIDSKNGFVRIIDYKTGIVENKFKGIESLFDRTDLKRNKAVFQLLFYSFLFLENNPDVTTNITPGLYALRSVFKSDFDFRIVKDEDKEKVFIEDIRPLLPDFRENLSILLEEIFDKNIPFDQAEDVRTCLNCAYRSICNR